MPRTEKNIKNVSALCIAGERDEYVKELSAFYEYLIDEAGFPEDRSYFMSGKEYHNGQVQYFLRRFFKTARRYGHSHTAVLVYNGHGAEEGIFPDSKIITYHELADYIGMGLQFLFINNCCSSGAVIESWKERKLLPHYGSVLAAAGVHEDVTGASFLTALIHSAKNRRPFRRKVLHPYYDSSPEARGETEESLVMTLSPDSFQHPRRCGISLDYLLYPAER